MVFTAGIGRFIGVYQPSLCASPDPLAGRGLPSGRLTRIFAETSFLCPSCWQRTLQRSRARIHADCGSGLLQPRTGAYRRFDFVRALRIFLELLFVPFLVTVEWDMNRSLPLQSIPYISIVPYLVTALARSLRGIDRKVFAPHSQTLCALWLLLCALCVNLSPPPCSLSCRL